MTYGQVGMFEQHAWPAVDHNGTRQGSHIFAVAVDRTVFAGGFGLAVRALGQAKFGKACKCKAIVAQMITTAVMVTAVDVSHGHNSL